MTSDLRFAGRQLLKRPGFTAVVLLTLALCIGATTAIFSMVYALLLKPLPFPAPAGIVEIYNSFPGAGLDKFPCNVTQYADFKAHAPAYQAVGMFDLYTGMVGEESHAERIQGAFASGDIWQVLGITPVLGQLFTLTNDQPGEDRVVVITESFWRSHFQGDPAAVRRTLLIDGENFHVVGVVADSIQAMDSRLQFVRPMAWKASDINPQSRYYCNHTLYGRVAATSSLAEARSQVEALEKHYADTAAAQMKGFLDHSGHRIVISPLQVEKAGNLRATLYLLQWGVVFVLVIGCVNITNLLLARANSRQSELAVRTALGATRGAIARQLLTESLLLTFVGAALGVGLAWSGLQVINHFSARLMPGLEPFALDLHVLGFAAVLAGAVGLLIGITPIVHTLRTNLAAIIQRSSRSVAGSRGVRALSSVLVTAQIAVALVLLTGAGLLIHSFARALAVNPGFDPSNVIAGRVALPHGYDKQGAALAVERRVLDALKEIPGAESSALSGTIPFEGSDGILSLVLKETQLARDASQPGAFLIGASPDYFKTLHVQLLEGRVFDEKDLAAKAPRQDLYVVDERFEQRYCGGKSAVGMHFTFNDPAQEKNWPVIIGVVRNVPHNSVEDRSNQPFVYYPMPLNDSRNFAVFIRSTRPLSDLVTAVRQKLTAIDPGISFFDPKTLEGAISGSFDNRRVVMLLLGAFAVLALFLSALGIYGVLAYDVSQRTREIGVRGAIGASRGQIVGLVMRQGLWKAGIGLLIGLVGAVLLSHFMTGLLFDLQPTDPWSYVAVSLVLAGTAALASYLPARSAAAVQPVEALRAE